MCVSMSADTPARLPSAICPAPPAAEDLVLCEQFMLVYEYMAGGDLAKAIGRDSSTPRRFGLCCCNASRAPFCHMDCRMSQHALRWCFCKQQHALLVCVQLYVMSTQCQ